jgi:hypothetical protein
MGCADRGTGEKAFNDETMVWLAHFVLLKARDAPWGKVAEDCCEVAETSVILADNLTIG